MSNLPEASQKVSPSGIAYRSAPCQTHGGEISRKYLGMTAAGWVFHCRPGNHNFIAEPAPGVPRTIEEAAAARKAARRPDVF